MAGALRSLGVRFVEVDVDADAPPFLARPAVVEEGELDAFVTLEELEG